MTRFVNSTFFLEYLPASMYNMKIIDALVKLSDVITSADLHLKERISQKEKKIN